MGELETIERLVEEYQPRMEEIFGRKIGNVEVKEDVFPYPMVTILKTIYINPKLVNIEKEGLAKEVENRFIVHELAHIIDGSRHLGSKINLEIEEYLSEGFAEYVAFEFPEIYRDERVMERIKEIHKKEGEILKNSDLENQKIHKPYRKGHQFFKTVAEAIGRENVPKVFQNPPSMEEILEPEKYLERIGEKR